jgi:hypothetical protein
MTWEREFMTKRIIVLLTLTLSMLFFAAESYGQQVVTAAQVNRNWREVSSKPAGGCHPR